MVCKNHGKLLLSQNKARKPDNVARCRSRATYELSNGAE